MSLSNYLIDYIIKNAAEPYGDREHKRLVTDISNNPGIIGIEDYIAIYNEVELIKNKILVGKPDLVVVGNNDLYVVEAKVLRGSNIDNTKEKLNSQLKVAYIFFRESFSVAPKLIGVYRYGKGNKIHHYELEKRNIEDKIRDNDFIT